jgi:hypothetical protein
VRFKRLQRRLPTKQVCRKITKAGLWQECDGRPIHIETKYGELIIRPKRGDFFVSDYLEYNPSSLEIKDKRSKRKEAGEKGAEKRWHKRPDMQGKMANAMANARPFAIPTGMPPNAIPENMPPAPTPTPVGSTKVSGDSSNGEVVQDEDADFDIAKEERLGLLALMITNDKDRAILSQLGKRASQASIEKVYESACATKMRNPDAYILSALRDELSG